MHTYIDIKTANAMFNSLVSEFVKNGHHVTIIASQNGNLKTIIHKEGDAEVLRVRTFPLLNGIPLLKGIAMLLLSLQYKLAMKQFLPNRKFDLIVTPTPPITLTNLANNLKRKNNAKLLLILRDIFPQNAVDLRMMKDQSLFYRFFRSMEKKLYHTADAIGCMTEGNRKYIIEKNPEIKPSKVHYLPNWSNISSLPSKIDQEIIENKYGIKNKFVVIYGGNLGISQKVENIIDFAILNIGKRDLIVLVVGKGTHKNYLIKLIDKQKVPNVKVVEYMPRKEYEVLVSLSKVGFISLNENFTIPNIPSRTLTYYNHKKPVFAIVDPSTDFGKMLEEDESGFCCRYGEYDKYKSTFDMLYFDSELRNQLGNNGYNALLNKYTPEKTYQRIFSILSLV